MFDKYGEMNMTVEKFFQEIEEMERELDELLLPYIDELIEECDKF